MPNVQTFQEGAQVLQQVDVSDIFTSLALGIAEAQEKLDNNSIAQIIKLADTKVGEKSLLELGFFPAFYAFQYADISANLHLKMALRESFGIGFQATFNLAKSKNYTNEEAKFVSESRYNSLYDEYKSSREFSFKANKSTSVKIDGRTYSYEAKDNIKKELRELREEISKNEKIDFVIQDIHARELKVEQATGLYAWIDQGYLRIEEQLDFKPGITVGLLRIKNLAEDDNVPDFDLNGPGNNNPAGTFGNNSNFEDLLIAARNANLNNYLDNNQGTIFGISKDGKFYEYDGTNSFNEIPTDIYFKFNDSEILYRVDLKYQRDKSDVTTYGNLINENHDKHRLFHQCLRFINQHDPDVRFTIKGFTDPVGGNSRKNQLLAKRRAEAMRDHIFNDSTKVNVTIETQTSESGNSDLALRKASISLNNNYVIFIGGKINTSATPGPYDNKENKFVHLKAIPSSPNHYALTIMYGGRRTIISEKENIQDIISELRKENFKYIIENHYEADYFLHEEAVVKYTLFSETEETIEIEDTMSMGESEEGSESSTVISDKKDRLTSDLENLSNKSGSNTFAIGASLDIRYARQFEMSVEGNASMSARLIALPPPEGFKTYIDSLYG
ncbi:MAG: hypothetical protein N2050_04820 [Flavobacteriales bacterium]|nr:hypothetical protein [Flavobacteriales bacterium]